MNKFKFTTLAFIIGFSVTAQAADNTNKVERTLVKPNAAIMGDCASMTGKEKGMCEKEMHDRDNKSNTDRARLNKERDTRNDTNNRSESSKTLPNNSGTNAKGTERTGPESGTTNMDNPNSGTNKSTDTLTK